MNNRLFKHVFLEKELESKSSSGKEEKPVNPSIFTCLNGNDAITARVSDHHPIIHDGVLFWNVMMQGKPRIDKETGIITGYNNGFGIIENDEQYIRRIIQIAHVIAEIVSQHPSIETIGLCEGPIEFLHSHTLKESLKKFACMSRFFERDMFYKPNVDGYQNWGLLMLTDRNNRVSEMKCDIIERSAVFSELANRFQLWKFTSNGKDKYFALGHFPFGGDEYVTEKFRLSTTGNIYSQLINDLINHHANDHFIFCADFNFNPYLVSQWQDRAIDHITNNNSILLNINKKSMEKTIKTVTVDGVLLSQKEKQKYYISKPNPSLFGRLAREYYLFKSYVNTYLEENRQKNSDLQNEYDKRFGLVPC
jgi:hypothetical protein